MGRAVILDPDAEVAAGVALAVLAPFAAVVIVGMIRGYRIEIYFDRKNGGR
jgi:hypothetical protein